MPNKISALVLSGDGINCEVETAQAAQEAGFEARIQHVNDCLKDEGKLLSQSRLLILPGGFSFGDDLGSGKILALKLKHGLGKVLQDYIDAGGAVLGICNGFQVLVRLGIFGSDLTLAQNAQGHFVNQWVGLEIVGSSIFTDGLKKKGITRLELPIRHGEGKLVFGQGLRECQAVLKYEKDVNGSEELVAGLSSHHGRVLGLMPHPEAFWSEELHPWGNGRGVPLGVELFSSAYDFLSRSHNEGA